MIILVTKKVASSEITVYNSLKFEVNWRRGEGGEEGRRERERKQRGEERHKERERGKMSEKR